MGGMITEREGNGMRLYWVDGYEIRVAIQDGSAVVAANREGLLSLSNHLAALAKEPPAATSISTNTTLWRTARPS